MERFFCGTITVIYLGLIGLSLSACQSSSHGAPKIAELPEHMAAPATKAETTRTETATAMSSILNPGDKVRITVFNDPDLSGEYDVGAEGTITMPLLGNIQAGGLSLPMLQRNITDRLKDGLLVDPKLSIELVSLRPFYILGEVRNPGSYPSVPNLDVFKAVAIAGGLTPRGVSDKFIIYRGFDENRKVLSAREETPVFPGDSIKVKERFF